MDLTLKLLFNDHICSMSKRINISLKVTINITGGFSRCGNPLIILPDNHLFFDIMESDLHMVLKYFIQIIPMAKQVRYFYLP